MEFCYDCGDSKHKFGDNSGKQPSFLKSQLKKKGSYSDPSAAVGGDGSKEDVKGIGENFSGGINPEKSNHL